MYFIDKLSLSPREKGPVHLQDREGCLCSSSSSRVRSVMGDLGMWPHLCQRIQCGKRGAEQHVLLLPRVVTLSRSLPLLCPGFLYKPGLGQGWLFAAGVDDCEALRTQEVLSELKGRKTLVNTINGRLLVQAESADTNHGHKSLVCFSITSELHGAKSTRVARTQWCSVSKLCLTLCNSLDCSPPGSSVHGISQARILEWAAFLSPGNLPDPEIEPTSPASPALAGWVFMTEPGKPPHSATGFLTFMWNRCGYKGAERAGWSETWHHRKREHKAWDLGNQIIS